MAMHAETASRPGMWRRWFAFVGGGLAWTFHLLTIYVIGEFGCVSGFDRNTYLGISGVAWLLMLVSVLALIPAVAAMLVGYADTKHDRNRPEPDKNDEGERYLSSYGWPLNALFVMIIIVESLPVFAYLKGC